MTRLALAALFIVTAAQAAAELPPGVTCEFVRAKVAEYGKVYAYAWARLHGYSAAQIAEAKRCLK